MDEKMKLKIEKLAKKLTGSDLDEAISILEGVRKACQQQMNEMREKEAAKILLDNVGYLLENKSKLDPDFVKQIENMGIQAQPPGVKKRGRKKKEVGEKSAKELKK